MTQTFDQMNDRDFERNWVAELLDQLIMDGDGFVSFGQLAKVLTDVRTRYRLMTSGGFKVNQRLNPVQIRIILRLRGLVLQQDLAIIFQTSQQSISNILLGRTRVLIGGAPTWPTNGSC